MLDLDPHQAVTFDDVLILPNRSDIVPSQVNTQGRFSRNIVNALTARNEEKWQSNLGTSGEFEALSIVVAENAVVAVARYQDIRRATPQYNLTAFNPADGKQLFQAPLPSEPLPGGLIIDRNGRILVSLLDGGMVCYGK